MMRRRWNEMEKACRLGSLHDKRASDDQRFSQLPLTPARSRAVARSVRFSRRERGERPGRSLCLVAFFLLSLVSSVPCAGEDLYPKHIDARTQAAIKRGLDYLAHTQSPDGNWNGTQDGAT